MTYAFGKVVYEMERMDPWIQNLVTYSDMAELAESPIYVSSLEIRGRLIAMARERRDSQ